MYTPEIIHDKRTGVILDSEFLMDGTMVVTSRVTGKPEERLSTKGDARELSLHLLTLANMILYHYGFDIDLRDAIDELEGE